MMECMNVSALLLCAISQVLDPAPAPVPVTLPPVVFEWISTNGETREAALIAMEGGPGKGTAQVRDARGGVTAISLSDIACAWRVSPFMIQNVARSEGAASMDEADPSTGPASSSPLWTVQLTDGQRFRGTLSPATNVESVTLALPVAAMAESASTNAISFPLDRISRVWKGAEWPRGLHRSAADSSRDVLWLGNGDVVSGFVAEIGPVIKIEPQTTATGVKVQDVPLESAAAVWLTNGASSMSGMRIGWQDGTVTGVSSCIVSDRVSRAVLSIDKGVHVQSALEDIRWLLPDASRWRPFTADAVAPSEAIASNEQGVLLTEPGTFSWPVKPVESHFVAEVTLPSSCLDWGDCTLIVRVTGANPKEIARLHLDAETPRHRLNIPLAGATAIQCEVDPGPSGPIQDRVQFSRAGFITAPK